MRIFKADFKSRPTEKVHAPHMMLNHLKLKLEADGKSLTFLQSAIIVEAGQVQLAYSSSQWHLELASVWNLIENRFQIRPTHPSVFFSRRRRRGHHRLLDPDADDDEFGHDAAHGRRAAGVRGRGRKPGAPLMWGSRDSWVEVWSNCC